MTALFVLGILISTSSLVALGLVRASAIARAAMVVVGIAGLTFVLLDRRRVQQTTTTDASVVRDECSNLSRDLRVQARSIRELGADPKDPTVLVKWHQAAGAAEALWSLCVGKDCYHPWYFDAKPEVMEELAGLLESAKCLPLPGSKQSSLAP